MEHKLSHFMEKMERKIDALEKSIKKVQTERDSKPDFSREKSSSSKSGSSKSKSSLYADDSTKN